MREVVSIEKIVHGGQGLATLKDGRKVFVWNALPGEVVEVRITKSKKSYAEGIAEAIITPSSERVVPLEPNYLATSPWQMMTFEAENTYKKQIVTELFAHEGINLPTFEDTIHDDRQWFYRNKMEYSFWGDEDGLHLALHERGSHGKQIVTGSKLAMSSIDVAANAICQQLNAMNARAGDLKTLIIRCNQQGEAVGSLFTKLDKFKQITLPNALKGLRVYHSNPKSPASVMTRLLYELGDANIEDKLLGKPFVYDVDSFFQVNVPIFERALTAMKNYVSEAMVTDMYAGVGVIGLSLATKEVNLIEIHPATVAMARKNAHSSDIRADVIEASTENALDYITNHATVIFDPPRAGLHAKITDCLLEVLPPQVIYLSCNPATQARDVMKLQSSYSIEQFKIFNFFPRTPHIETLAVLSRKTTELS